MVSVSNGRILDFFNTKCQNDVDDNLLKKSKERPFSLINIIVSFVGMVFEIFPTP